MAEEKKIAARDTVGMVLMGSEEADVAVAVLRGAAAGSKDHKRADLLPD